MRFCSSSRQVVTKMRSPQTMGEEWPLPGMGTRQKTLSVLLQWVGMSVSSEVPSPCGPRQLGQSAAKDAARWHERLTEREGDVLRLMAKGLSNAEIGQELFVSPQTVKTHVGNVLAKTQARDRTQAVIFAYESGFKIPNWDEPPETSPGHRA